MYIAHFTIYLSWSSHIVYVSSTDYLSLARDGRLCAPRVRNAYGNHDYLPASPPHDESRRAAQVNDTIKHTAHILACDISILVAGRVAKLVCIYVGSGILSNQVCAVI